MLEIEFSINVLGIIFYFMKYESISESIIKLRRIYMCGSGKTFFFFSLFINHHFHRSMLVIQSHFHYSFLLSVNILIYLEIWNGMDDSREKVAKADTFRIVDEKKVANQRKLTRVAEILDGFPLLSKTYGNRISWHC